MFMFMMINNQLWLVPCRWRKRRKAKRFLENESTDDFAAFRLRRGSLTIGYMLAILAIYPVILRHFWVNSTGVVLTLLLCLPFLLLLRNTAFYHKITMESKAYELDHPFLVRVAVNNDLTGKDSGEEAAQALCNASWSDKTYARFAGYEALKANQAYRLLKNEIIPLGND